MPITNKSINRLILIPFLLLITLSINSYSIKYNNQLETMGGLAEEYFLIGLHLFQTGTLCLNNEYPSTSVFRPPGYSFFIGTVIKIWGGITHYEGALQGTIKEINPEVLKKTNNAVYFAQALLLSLSTVVLYIWLSTYISLNISFIISLLFGCSPYMIIMTGLLHYEILHIFLIVISTFSLIYITDKHSDSSWKMMLPGILWGLSTLTRPITLILPVFVFLLFCILFKNSKKKIIELILLFIFGMSIVILPYTIRNYSITKEFIPVNAQSGVALWGGTVTKLERSPNHYRWWNIWYVYGCPIYYRIINPNDDHTCAVNYISQAVSLDREFKKEAIHNISQRPMVYLYNVIDNFITINLDINSIIIKLFQAKQNTYKDKQIEKQWFDVGNPQTFYPSGGQTVFEVFIYLLELFSLLGIIIFIKKVYITYYSSGNPIKPETSDLKIHMKRKMRREMKLKMAKQKPATTYNELSESFLLENTYFLIPIIIYITLCIAHSITYMDLMYYYFKVPFLFIFTSYFFNEIDKYQLNNKIKLSNIFSTCLLAYGILLILIIIIF
jgi:hypothetical protein